MLDLLELCKSVCVCVTVLIKGNIMYTNNGNNNRFLLFLGIHGMLNETINIRK